jgi:hypothetical protein
MEETEKQNSTADVFSDPFSQEAKTALEAEHNHYAALGRVAAAWSFLEAGVDTACIRLADIESDRGICLTSQIAGIGRKLDAYISLARLRALPKELIERLDKFAKLTQGVSEKRNRLVHDIWFFNHPLPPERLQATARKLLRFEYIPTKTEDILKTAREINDLHGEFEVLDQAVETWPLRSPDISPSQTV